MGVGFYVILKGDETKDLWIGGYGSFFRLRSLIAEVYDHQMGLDGEFAALYQEQLKGFGVAGTKEFWDDYNKRLNEFEKKYRLSSRVLDFLYQPDCDGRLTPDGCRQIWKIMSDTKSCVEVFAKKEWYDHTYPKFGSNSKPCNWLDIANYFEKAWLDKKTVYWS